MYKVIGGDNKEYGPISADQVRQWLTDGRLNANSSIQSDADPQWKPLHTFTELQTLCSGNVPATGVAAPKTCGLAVVSLVLGCFTLFCALLTAVTGIILGIVALSCSLLTAVPGVILGIAGLRKINRSAVKLTGKGMAITGTCVSALVMVFCSIVIIAAIKTPVFLLFDSPRAAGCTVNMRELRTAIQRYAQDNNGRLPDAARWCDAIQKYAPEKRTFQCPTSHRNYLFNRNLSGIELSRISDAEKTVLLFEGNGNWNATGTAADLPAAPPHHVGCKVLFVGGESGFIPKYGYGNLRWQADK